MNKSTYHNQQNLSTLFHQFVSQPLPDIVVFSHLRWEFVFQRPQHIMTRLAKKTRILFVEEPIAHDAKDLGKANVFSPWKNVTVIQPKIDSLNQIDLLTQIIDKTLQKLAFHEYMTWFYSPTYVDLLSKFKSLLVIYDCMDELSAFRGAPKELVDNEKKLLKYADIVFTGGKSLYESKVKKTANIHCFPSSVDQKHFSQENVKKFPKDIAKLKRPLAGYYGVIDERIHLQLLQEIATLLPEINFVMIGPVVKIDQKSLPTNKNIVYLGQKNYQDLPAYLHAFDVAMMPFALNDATQFISPTKTLEFMAAGKPIVSTPITDVVRDYDHVIEIAKTAEEFAWGIKKLLYEPVQKKAARFAKQKEIMLSTSWDKTVQQMEKAMRTTLSSKWSPIETSAQSLIPALSWRMAYDPS